MSVTGAGTLTSVWDEVLTKAVSVVWFDRWDDGKCFEEDHKRLLLRRADASGRLLLAPPAALPPGAPPAARPNPSWDFVAWCREHQLADVSPALARQLFDELPAVRFPPLPGAPGWARPAVQGLLGDYKGARNSYLRIAMRPGSQRKVGAALGMSLINHGGDGVAAMLAPAAVLPAWGRLGRAGELARRKRIAAWSHTARYDAVLRATRQLPGDAVSTYLILRSQAQRVTGSLDEAARTASTARIRARAEHHPVRTAHAAFQECLALLWAERLDEAGNCLAEYLKPYAALAASRWVAWADFIAGALAVREASADAALAGFLAAETRFRAESLLDGVVSVKTARLAAHRLAGDASGYARELAEVSRLSRAGDRGQRYYTRQNIFTAESIDIDHAEFTRACQHDLPAAWQVYEHAAASRYPLHAALAHLGLALIEAERGEFPRHAQTATQIAAGIGSRLVTTRSGELLARRQPSGATRQVFFC